MVEAIKADAIALAVRIKTLQYITGRAVDLSRAVGVNSPTAVSLIERSKPSDWNRVAEAINLATESFGTVLDRQRTAISVWREFESELRSDSAIHVSPEAK